MDCGMPGFPVLHYSPELHLLLELTAYCIVNVQANLSTVRVQNHDVKFTNG